MKLIKFIISTIILTSCQNVKYLSYNSLKSEDFSAMEAFYSYVNPDGTKNAYIVDSIQYQPNDYVIIYSPATKRQFIVSKSCYSKNRKLTDKALLDDPRTSIFRWYFARGNNESYIGFRAKDENDFNRKLVRDTEFSSKDGYDVYDFEDYPIFLRVYMVRGDIYNYMNNRTNEYKSPFRIDFPDPRGYYKVVVPIWNNIPNGIKNVERLKSYTTLDDYENWNPRLDNIKFPKVGKRILKRLRNTESWE